MPSVARVSPTSATAWRMSARSCVICSTTCGRRTLMATYDPAFGASAGNGTAAAPVPAPASPTACGAMRARCTWAMDADPSGFSSMHENVSRHGCPSDSSMVASTVENGMGGTSARSRLNASAYAGGMTSLRFAAICPIFTNVGPKSSSKLVAFSGVRPDSTRCCRRMRSISRRRLPDPDPLSRRASTATCATSLSVATPHLLVSPVQPTFDSPAYHGTMRRVHRLPSGYRTDAEPEEDGRKRTPPRPAQTGAVEGGATRREGRERVRPVGLDDRSSGRHAGDPACRADAIAAYASIVSTAYCPARRPPQ